jgi:hypothetical protein
LTTAVEPRASFGDDAFEARVIEFRNAAVCDVVETGSDQITKLLIPNGFEVHLALSELQTAFDDPFDRREVASLQQLAGLL